MPQPHTGQHRQGNQEAHQEAKQGMIQLHPPVDGKVDADSEPGGDRQPPPVGNEADYQASAEDDQFEGQEQGSNDPTSRRRRTR